MARVFRSNFGSDTTGSFFTALFGNIMAGGGHDALAAMWKDGREGTMSPWTQALALALKEAWAD